MMRIGYFAVNTRFQDFSDIMSRHSICPETRIRDGGIRRLERIVSRLRYTQVCCARLDGLSERFRRVAMSSDLVLMSVLGQPRTQWFLVDFSRQLYSRKWPSFRWLERGDNDALKVPLRVHSNEDLWGRHRKRHTTRGIGVLARRQRGPTGWEGFHLHTSIFAGVIL